MPTLMFEKNGSNAARRCDARCYDARHSVCDCVCGGVNHKVGFLQALNNTQTIFGTIPKGGIELQNDGQNNQTSGVNREAN
jgi:hypothetical protein